MGAKELAREYAQVLNLARPSDEVVLYDYPVSTPYPPPKQLEEWVPDVVLLVSKEKRGYSYGG
jgi:hypothetical protein